MIRWPRLRPRHRRTHGLRRATQALFLRACRREPVERTPIWIMRQAGRYLPEYRALREKHDFLTSCRTPEIACEITLQPVRRLAWTPRSCSRTSSCRCLGWASTSTFTPGPQLERDDAHGDDVAALRVPDPHESTPYVLDAIRLLRQELPRRRAADWLRRRAVHDGDVSGRRPRHEDSSPRSSGCCSAAPDVAHALLSTCAETVAVTWRRRSRPAPRRRCCSTPGRRCSRLATIGRSRCRTCGGSLPTSNAWLSRAGLEVPRHLLRRQRGRLARRLRRRGRDGDRSRLAHRPRSRQGARLEMAGLQGNLDPTVLLGTSDEHSFATRRDVHSPRRARSATSSISATASCRDTPPDHARVLVDAVARVVDGEDRMTPVDFDSLVALIRRYDRPGPRYTSYPTAVEFSDAFRRSGVPDAARRDGGDDSTPMSLYLHLPFCEERCSFCGCTVVITKKREVAAGYLTICIASSPCSATALGTRRQVVQYHWGGGTPTYLSLAQIDALQAVVDAPLRHPRRAPKSRSRSIRASRPSSSWSCCATSASTGCRSACRTSRRKCRRPINRIQSEPLTRTLFDGARATRVRVDQHRSDLRAAAADTRVVRQRPSTPSWRCGPIAWPSTRTRTCRGFARTRST